LDKNTVISMIDHAVLKPEATDNDVLRECEIAARYGVASVCVKPCHVALAREALKDSKVKVSTVIGFPTVQLQLPAKCLRRWKPWKTERKNWIW